MRNVFLILQLVLLLLLCVSPAIAGGTAPAVAHCPTQVATACVPSVAVAAAPVLQYAAVAVQPVQLAAVHVAVAPQPVCVTAACVQPVAAVATVKVERPGFFRRWADARARKRAVDVPIAAVATQPVVAAPYLSGVED